MKDYKDKVTKNRTLHDIIITYTRETFHINDTQRRRIQAMKKNI